MIGDILQELRKDFPLDQDELADKFGISRSAISSYERGITDPPSSVLIKYSKFFNVSTDYLCGLTRDRTSVKESSYEFSYRGNTLPLSTITSILHFLSLERCTLLFDLLHQLKQAQQGEYSKSKKNGKKL